MTRQAFSCSDVLLTYNQARAAVGDQAALAVVNRLGARYAATIAPKDYETAIRALSELIRQSQVNASVAAVDKAAA